MLISACIKDLGFLSWVLFFKQSKINNMEFTTYVGIYFVIGIIFTIVCAFREFLGHTMGEADMMLVLSLILGWPIYLLGVIIRIVLKYLTPR